MTFLLNDNRLGYGIRLLVNLVACCGLLPFLTGVPLRAEDAAEKSLKSQDYPWYDQETGGFVPLDIPDSSPDFQNAEVDMSLWGTLISYLSYGLLWGLIIILAIWLIILFVRALIDRPTVLDDQKLANSSISQERLELLPEMTRGTTDFLGEAEKLANSADYSRAMVFYYAWQLLTLGDHEVIELATGKTNRQYVRETSKRSPAIKELFAKSVRMFEDSIYGGVILSEIHFNELWQRRQEFRQASVSNRTTGKSSRRGLT
ncbi:DUF4129 domain-containing protein [Rubinisphaera sp.]|uniref:DUF4129 domain-containing protein n=1 Tax=Rubinisphaera sp. TaxID=2024857 RepID=UPI000C0CE909|nr:DUF4129 domain-containing protein [Rubinisphaera sp.]MBV11191.1 hypothetical protein [Rubinisphaera sp.]HCS51013.1 hypothetical protein [Planctomycetaceae bacterium]|tara:strand:+ start:7633 stop:8412 length:780 start_codon:yes stop_codon:yes gene_type:complete